MSHSPSETASETAREQYTQQWHGLVRLLREGRSFSGRERNCCFLNTGQTQYADISAVSGLDFPEDSRAVLPIDWDFDGDLDLWLIGRTAPRVRLMENRIIQQTHFLAVRLEGRDANRDAVGARVELYRQDQPDQTLIRTVRAGEGFESQSSKWLHFGLGDAPHIDRLVVRWPGGEKQTFRDFTADRWFRITQGSQRPEAWTPPLTIEQSATLTAPIETETHSTSHQGKPSNLDTMKIGPPTRNGSPELLPDPIESSRPLVLASPIPMPRLWVITGPHATTPLAYQRGEMTLINLWATWCVPCAEELQEFGAAQQVLRDHKLRIVLLNVDGLRDSGRGNPGQAAAMLDRLGYPNEQGLFEQSHFIRGRATEALLTKLQRLQMPLLESGSSLVTPTSFLISGEGMLLAIYQGPVKVKRLIKDLDQHFGPSTDQQQAGGMFPGRWLQRPTYWELIGKLGDAFRDTHMLPEALLYYHRAHQLKPEHPYLKRQYEQIRTQLQAVRSMLQQCQEIVRDDPDHADALARLGFANQALGDHQQAVLHLRRAVTIKGDDSQTHTALGVSLAYLGEMEQAQQQFQQAVILDPGNQQAQENLDRFRRQ